MRSRRIANILFLIALLVGAFFLKQYLGIFALAALTALIFTPLHNWFLRRKGKTAKFATVLTLFAVVCSLLIPLFTLIGLSFYEASQVKEDIKKHSVESGQRIDKATSAVRDSVADLGVNISQESLQAKLRDAAKKVVPGIVGFIFKTTGSIVSFITSGIVYLMVLAAMLGHKRELIATYKRLSPFDDSIDSEYLDKVKIMAISMVKGTFIIAIIVGAISTVTLWIVGMSYLAFWFMLFTILSLIPLGAGIIYVPIGIIMLLSGNIWQGVLILATQFVVLNNVDNVMRPRLAKGSNLPGILVLVSTFAGVGYFGMVGVIYGPIIMVLIYTTIQLYDKYKYIGLPLKTPASS